MPSNSANADLLREKYEQLWKTANVKPRDPNQVYALKIICLTRHKVAVEYQKQFVLGEIVSSDPFTAAVTSLISTRDPEVIKLLVENFLDRKDVERNQQRYVLHQLRLARAYEWEKARYKELIPYREMIKNAESISSTPND